MNYSTFNQTYKTKPYHGKPNYNNTQNSPNSPEFFMYGNDNNKNNNKNNKNNKNKKNKKNKKNSFENGYENAMTATKGIMCEDNLDPVVVVFFSDENVKRIQRMIKREVSRRTNGKYRLDDDQDGSDLLIAMRAVLFDANIGARYLPFKINRQVNNLNFQTVQYVVPDMISNMKQQYGYLKEINQPLQPMLRPMNVSSAGRKTLPSITTIYDI